MTLKIILLDDLHLEGREAIEVAQLASKLNEIIAQIKVDGHIPLIVCAGDISEGVEGVRWISQFHTNTIYVCGNHEFWGQDYYETYENITQFIQKENLSFIHFLNNDTIEIEGVRFIGSTLWTNIGSFLPWYPKNNMVKFYPAMGDFKRTTAKRWYTPTNIQRLTQYLTSCGVEKDKIQTLIEQKLFNPLLEREENHRSTEYLLSNLSEQFSGKTIVLTHHLPVFEIWNKIKGITEQDMCARNINSEKYFIEGIKNNDIAKELLMMGYYANDLKEFMYGELAPNFWLHGHLHAPVQEIVGRTKIISSPMGYKKQNSELQYKIFSPEDEKSILKNYLLEEINKFNWNENLINSLKNLEQIIIKAEQGVSMNIFSWQDMLPMVQALTLKHQQDISKFSEKLSEWFNLIIFYEHPEIHDKKFDFYLTEQILNLSKHEIVFSKALNISLTEKVFEVKNSQHSSEYNQILLDIQKMQIHLLKMKKHIIDFIEQY